LRSESGPLLDDLAAKAYKGLAEEPCIRFKKHGGEDFDPIDYPARVTSLLEQKQWDSSSLCAGGLCLLLRNKLKRGTVQRWVRFCDDCQSPGMKLKLIAGILKCTTTDNPNDGATLNRHDPRRVLMETEEAGEMGITNRMLWNAPPRKELEPIQDDDWRVPTDIQVVYHVPAKDRKPPNRHDLNMSYTDTCMLTQDYDYSIIEKHPVVPIPGAILLTNVLMAHECRRLIQTAEAMGYSPDHPMESSDPTGIDTCEWLAIQDSNVLFQRVLPHIPSTIQGEIVTGINARWRLFRYGTDSVYRPHIDGSWPASGLEEGNM
jgi:hypothetical protein